jgi:uncharacterized protein (DUF2141 family)
LKIENAEKNGGKYTYLFLTVNQPTKPGSLAVVLLSVLMPTMKQVTKDLSLPAGQYVFSIYQDSNGNGKLDTNLIGIPREKFGFSNYDGKSAPGSFNRHKVEIRRLQ